MMAFFSPDAKAALIRRSNIFFKIVDATQM